MKAWLGRVIGALVLALVAMVVALAITPRVPVTVFGQVVEVGAVRPSLSLGLSGPGEADLFGEGTVDTVQHFDGPIRPRIVWQRFNRNDDASQFIQSTSSGGRRVVRTGSQAVGAALSDGWSVYFRRLIVVAGLVGGGLYLFGVGVLTLLAGHERRHRSRRRHLAWLGAAIASSLLVTAGFTALTVVTAVRQLGDVRSLSDLVGTSNVAPVPVTVGTPRTDIDAVVIGDSTAAGIGNASLAKPTRQDTACRRSSDAYAVALQSTSGLRVLNLACSSATIAAGLLGPQTTRGVTLPPQVGVLQSIASVSLVVVSVGANDAGWSDFLSYCYGLPRCDDQASDSLFQSRLDGFKIQYAQLLQQLADLPSHPAVIINEYYDPFGTTFDCADLKDPKARAGGPTGYGFGADPGLDEQATKDNQADKVKAKIEPLRSELRRLNSVLEQGASAFGFTAVQPRFDGHGLCADQSWVQGMNDPAPFHPRAAGELAIAAADLPYVSALPGPPS